MKILDRSPEDELILAELPSFNPNERCLVVLSMSEEGSSKIELRHQSFGAGIGWFTQSSLSLDAAQLERLGGLIPEALSILEKDPEGPIIIKFPGPRL